jgi:hypothetical protein
MRSETDAGSHGDAQALTGRATSRRAAWGIADQAFSSVTNFALTAFVARAVAPAEFGRFALIFAVYLLALGVGRSLFTVPLMVRFTGVGDDEWREGVRSATGAAAAAGTVAAIGCAIASLFFDGVRGPLIALAVTLPGLLVQDSWRHAFFAHGRPAKAFANDLVWAIALVPVFAFCLLTHITSADAYVLGWGVAGTVGGVFGVFQSGLLPAPRRLIDWIRRHWDISGRQLGEFVALSGSNQLVMFAAAAIGGLVTAGALRGAQVVMGPLNVGYQGIWVVALAESVRVLRRRPEYFVRVNVWLSSILALGGVVYWVGMLVLGSKVGPMLVGATWPNAESVLTPIALTIIAWGGWLGATIGLRALQENKKSLHARMVTSLTTVVVGVAGVTFGGTLGVAWGLALAYLIGVVVWWLQFASAIRRRHGDLRPGPPDARTDAIESVLEEAGA